MPVKKIAISVPEGVVETVDRAARALGVSRSRFISDVLRRVASARTDLEITRRIDRLFQDPEMRCAQAGTSAAFRRAVEPAPEEW